MPLRTCTSNNNVSTARCLKNLDRTYLHSILRIIIMTYLIVNRTR